LGNLHPGGLEPGFAVEQVHGPQAEGGAIEPAVTALDGVEQLFGIELVDIRGHKNVGGKDPACRRQMGNFQHGTGGVEQIHVI
jgi:hypothetical protein